MSYRSWKASVTATSTDSATTSYPETPGPPGFTTGNRPASFAGWRMSASSISSPTGGPGRGAPSPWSRGTHRTGPTAAPASSTARARFDVFGNRRRFLHDREEQRHPASAQARGHHDRHRDREHRLRCSFQDVPVCARRPHSLGPRFGGACRRRPRSACRPAVARKHARNTPSMYLESGVRPGVEPVAAASADAGYSPQWRISDAMVGRGVMREGANSS